MAEGKKLKNKKSIRALQMIGRKEKIDLPDFGLHHLDAKIDTGAYSSSIHCRILNETEIEGVPHITFIPLAKKYKARNAGKMTVPITKRKRVKSSSGHTEERYIVSLKVALAGWLIDTEFSLSDRSSMKHTILLGRKFLRKRFTVDVSKKYVYYNKEKYKQLQTH